MATKLEKLFFSIDLINNASGPASKIAGDIDKISARATNGMKNIAVGGAGLWGVGMALNTLTQPSREMSKALGEVSALDVSDDALKQLERSALSYSASYGESAVDFVSASYDIQSAIAGLNGTELSRFTTSSAILAKATKSDTGTITAYMGTMYGIFQNQANLMGKSNWAEKLSGQTATAVQMFKTTGSEMSAAFTGLGADATSMGIGMGEQMAILGTLQATMSGSEAGTKYRAFLGGVGKAQDALGLQFTDSHGRMLPMIEILGKLQNKFGAIDTVAESDALKNAFGTKEAVGMIKLLMQNTHGLESSINALGNVTGMDKARQMALKQVDIWEQFGHTMKAIHIIFGRVLGPTLASVLGVMQSGAETVIDWTQKFPNLTRVVGGFAFGVLTLIALVSGFALTMGIAQMAMAGYGTMLVIGSGLMKAFAFVSRMTAATLTTLRFLVFISSVMFGALSTSLGLGTAAAWLFNAALWANPMTWIVVGVLALVGAIAAAVIYWDRIKATIMDSGPFKMLQSFLGGVIDLLNKIPGIDIQMGSTIEPPVMPDVGAPIDVLPKQPESMVLPEALTMPAMNPANDMVYQPQMDPGVLLNQQAELDRLEMNRALTSMTAVNSNNSGVPTGGLMQEFQNNQVKNNSGTRVDKIEVNTTQKVSGWQLADELMMAAG